MVRARAARLAAAGLVCSSVLAFAAPAARPAAALHFTPSDRREIGTLIDRFVKDAVLRQNLAEGWTLAGPDLRGGTTRKAWIAGTGVTVERFPAAGNDFSHSWTGKLVAPGHAELAVILHPRKGSTGYDETAATVDVRKIRGRWLVDLFYSAAVFSKRGVSGPNDFKAGGPGNPLAQSRISGRWLWIGLAAAGALVLGTPLGFWAAARRRHRAALAAYQRH